MIEKPGNSEIIFCKQFKFGTIHISVFGRIIAKPEIETRCPENSEQTKKNKGPAPTNRFHGVNRNYRGCNATYLRGSHDESLRRTASCRREPARDDPASIRQRSGFPGAKQKSDEQ